MRLHPDTNPDLPKEVSEAQFIRLLEAYEEVKWNIEHFDARRSGVVDGNDPLHRSTTAGMSAEEARERFKAPFDQDIGSRIFQAFLKDKEGVWERLNVAWEKNLAYNQAVLLEMKSRAMEVGYCYYYFFVFFGFLEMFLIVYTSSVGVLTIAESLPGRLWIVCRPKYFLAVPELQRRTLRHSKNELKVSAKLSRKN